MLEKIIFLVGVH